MKLWNVRMALRAASIGLVTVLASAPPAEAKKFKLFKSAAKAVNKGGKAVAKGVDAVEDSGKSVVKAAGTRCILPVLPS